MASKFLARRIALLKNKKRKSATTLVSTQSLELAIEEANALVNQFMNTDAHDERLDQLEDAISFLTSVLKKSNADMQQEGASSIEDYLDDAIMPEFARKIKQDVDMISNMKNAGNVEQQPVMASGSDNWVSDRDDNGEAKAELMEVPRLAAKKCEGKKGCSSKATCSSTSEGKTKWFCSDCYFRENGKKKADAAVPPAAPAPSKASADITQLNSDTLAKIQKALAGTDDLMNDKAAQAFIAAIAEELMNRPVEVEQEKPAAMPMAASVVGGLHLAFEEAEDVEEAECPECRGMGVPLGALGRLMHYRCRQCGSNFSEKIHTSDPRDFVKSRAANQGGSFVNDGETGSVIEDAGRTPEIADAHSELEDNTGIKRPATELVTKFAGDMTTTKAVKMTETLSTQLKGLYLDAKKVTEVLDARPVREAVESIYRAYDMMGEATKVLNKQKMQEEQEEQAIEIKEKNKKKSSSLMFGLNVAAEEEE